MWAGGVNCWDISGYTIGTPELNSCLNITNHGNITIPYKLRSPGINVDTMKALTLNDISFDDNVLITGCLTLINSWDSVSGSINLVHTTANCIYWRTVGTAAPSFTTTSIGAKLVLYPHISTSTTDYDIVIENIYLWFSTASTSTGHRWYCGISKVMELLASGVVVSGKTV